MGDIVRISSFTGANFTGFLGQSFRFQTLNDAGEATGNVLSGQVKRIFRQRRQICVEFYIPDKRCTHIHEAKRIYFKGWAAVLWRASHEEAQADLDRLAKQKGWEVWTERTE